MPSLEANKLLAAAVDAADSKKAEEIRILALDPSESSLTDYFLICNGTNERQNAAIADEIDLRLKKDFNVMPNSVEGRRQGEWVLMDYVDFVVHIFTPEKREYYGLERLRKTAKALSPADLDEEIKAALTKTRAKKMAIRAIETMPRVVVNKSATKSGAKKAAKKIVVKKSDTQTINISKTKTSLAKTKTLEVKPAKPKTKKVAK